MKSSTLLFKSLAIIIFIAGTAHLVNYLSLTSKSSESNLYWKEHASNSPTSEIENSEVVPSSIETEQDEFINYETDYIIGKWKVTYSSKDFDGVIVYDVKKESKAFHAYTYEYQDRNGNIEKAKKTKVLIIQKFDGYKGEGIYVISYEGKQYDVKCNIDMIDENTFKLSYEYYGYSDVETWKKI